VAGICLLETLVFDLVLQGQLLGLRVKVLLVREVLERFLSELDTLGDELGQLHWQVQFHPFQATVVLFL